MKRDSRLGSWAALSVLFCFPLAAVAQERGRTDGPEGSEFGKGGYSRRSSGQVSLELNWGASFQGDGNDATDVPLFVGGTVGYWANDWFIVTGNVNYLFNNKALSFLVGPRFRTATYPVSAFFGARAGAMVPTQEGGSTRFALSPEAGADLLLGDHLILALGYALDIPVSSDIVLNHRVFMNVGYRF
jgi:hypothetical protein